MLAKLLRKLRGSNEDDSDDSAIERRTVLRTAAGASAAGLASSSVSGSGTSESPEIADPVARYYTTKSERDPTEVHRATNEEQAVLTEQFMKHGGNLVRLLSRKGIFEATAVDMESFETGAAFSEIGAEETDTESAYIGLREVGGRLRSELYYKIQQSADEGVIDESTMFTITVIPTTGDAYAHSTPKMEKGNKKEVPQRLIDLDRDVAGLAGERGSVLGENDAILFGTCIWRCERNISCPGNCAEMRICCSGGGCSSEYTGYCCNGPCPSSCCTGPRDPCPDGNCPQ